MHVESEIKIALKRGGVGCFQIVGESLESQPYLTVRCWGEEDSWRTDLLLVLDEHREAHGLILVFIETIVHSGLNSCHPPVNNLLVAWRNWHYSFSPDKIWCSFQIYQAY